MEYAIGQNVIHPAHGPGEVIDIELQELTEGDQRYYVLHFADKRLTVRVPLPRCAEVGLRGIMSRDKSFQVMATLRQLPQRLPADFKQRHKQIESLIYSGAPVKVAEAVRELSWRRVHNKYLGIADQRLLREGKELLIQELALATEQETSQIETDVDAALAVSIEAKEAHVEEPGVDTE